MKILVTGAKGQLGKAVIQILRQQQIECWGADIEDFDITNPGDTLNCIQKYRPSIIIHCAAFCAVDLAEEKPEMCRNINVEGTRNIVNACEALGAGIVFISTDYIFDGEKSGEYETNDEAHPLSIYGKSKLEGERIVQRAGIPYYIIRTSWLFGQGHNFVNTMIALSKQKTIIDVVCDQIGAPTYAVDLAKKIYEIVESNKFGIYHVTNGGTCSWADFAEAILRSIGSTTQINCVLSAEYLNKAKRPYNSKLSNQSLIENGFEVLQHWQIALEKFLREKA